MEDTLKHVHGKYVHGTIFKLTIIILLLTLLTSCTSLSMPNLPLGQVSEAFKDGEISPGTRLDEQTYKVPLIYSIDSQYPGWNLIALPLGFTEEQMKIDVPYKILQLRAGGYVTGSDVPLTQGNAYWIKVERLGNVFFSGKWIQPVDNITQQMGEGWNQFGIATEPIKIRDVRVQIKERTFSLREAYQDALLIPVFYLWDAKKGDWLFLNAEKPESDEKMLYPGVGYFVYAKKPLTLVYTYPVPS